MANEVKQNDEVTAEVEGPGLAAKLTDRDRDLLGLLVLARYLTLLQVFRLAFDGRNPSVAYRRLMKLGLAAGGQPAFLRQRFFRTYNGDRMAVWAAEPHAMAAAVARAGPLPRLPTHDVKPQFLEHLVRLNDVFVDLWRAGDRCPRAVHPAFRWIPSDMVALKYGDGELGRDGKPVPKLIRPDAVLEVPGALRPGGGQKMGRRFFLECEMGTHTIEPGTDTSPGATLHKAERYHTFLTEQPWQDKRTHYDLKYPDGYATEVLFLEPDEGRVGRVNAALAKWKQGLADGGKSVAIGAITFERATASFRQMAGLPELAALPKPAPRPKPAPKVVAPPPPVSVHREPPSVEVRLVEAFAAESLQELRVARDLLVRAGKTELVRYPKSHKALQTLLAQWRAKRTG